jgi:hypothetical protein
MLDLNPVYRQKMMEAIVWRKAFHPGTIGTILAPILMEAQFISDAPT